MRLAKLKLAAACLVMPSTGCGVLFDQPSKRVASILQLDEVPASFRNGDCESWGFTDVLEACYFEIEPQDFPKLLTGYRFSDEFVGGFKGIWHDGKSHDWSGGPKVGSNFDVETAYTINPPEFEHGGHVRLVVNKDRTKAQVDIYIE